jgi:hypothetical protein
VVGIALIWWASTRSVTEPVKSQAQVERTA